jgi:HSP20 family protein
MEDKAMLMVRRNTQPTIADLFSNFFDSELMDKFDRSLKFSPKTNIVETDKAYRVDLMVPGFDKEDFNINIENDVMTISAHKEEKKEEKDGDKVVFSEYRVEDFERSFTLSQDVDSNKIEAAYENGILKVNIPKKKESIVKKLVKIK